VHLTASPIDWYVARASGVAAYVLLSVAVLVGVLMAEGRPRRAWPKFALEDVHRFLGLLTGSFVALHVVTIAIDSYTPFSFAQLVVPFASGYRTFWTALGIVAAELLVALALTNRYRKRLSYRFWRRAHYANFAVWGAATLHGLGSGTDRTTAWLWTLELLATAAVVGATVWRINRGTPRSRAASPQARAVPRSRSAA
jgi:sulfoxide reductase heme-binding subunit YedZ